MSNRREVIAAGVAMGLAGIVPAANAADAPRRPGGAAPSGKWLVTLEEHCLPPAVAADLERNPVNLRRNAVPNPPANQRPPNGPNSQNLLGDFRNQRLERMDACGIDMQVLSLTVTSGSPQQMTDPAGAHRLAQRANDALAGEVAKTPGNRFKAFASLSMHDPDVAARELERAVRQLGMCGVLLNNFQWSGEGGNKPLFYDDRRYDVFWSALEQLDVPLYLHPGFTPDVERRNYQDVQWLEEATWEWGSQTGFHALRMMSSGVFDRHPRAQLILGHMGEHILGDVWRIENFLRRRGAPAKKSVQEYLRTNVSITTSGQFFTPALQYAIKVMGADRVMFSVDYPFEDMGNATTWFASAQSEIDAADYRAVGRSNAMRLLKLGTA